MSVRWPPWAKARVLAREPDAGNSAGLIHTDVSLCVVDPYSQRGGDFKYDVKFVRLAKCHRLARQRFAEVFNHFLAHESRGLLPCIAG